jgi:hypothetical protein
MLFEISPGGKSFPAHLAIKGFVPSVLPQVNNEVGLPAVGFVAASIHAPVLGLFIVRGLMLLQVLQPFVRGATAFKGAKVSRSVRHVGL